MTAADGNPLQDAVRGGMLAMNGEISARAMRAAGFRALTPLFDKAQVVIDKAVLTVGLQRLAFVQDLLSEGLVVNLDDPLSVTQFEWNTTTQVGNAQRSMRPDARVENFLPSLTPDRVPVYLTMAGFELDIRTLRMSRRVGLPLDVTGVQSATRAVNEALEDAALNGATDVKGNTLSVGGYDAPGLLNAPNANTYAITEADWTNGVGSTILPQAQAMATALAADRYYGPYNLYVGTAIGNAMQGDFSTTKGELTIQQRLEQLQYGGRNLRVRVVDLLPANTAVMVQMTSDVVSLLQGQAPTAIPWTSLNGFIVYNLIMAIQVPLFRSDANGNSGVVVGT